MTTTHDAPPIIDPKYGATTLTVHRHAGQDHIITDGDFWRIERSGPDPFMDPCPPWCSGVDDDKRHRAFAGPCSDRDHRGYETMVVLEIEATDDQRDGTCIPEFLLTCLRQGVNEREPHLWLGLGETIHGVNLTLDETELLAEVLADITRRGRADGGDRQRVT